jgi:ADP-heptose:LPS heptosyltransferase
VGMDLRRKKIIDRYAGGLAIVVLKPLVKILGALLKRNHALPLGKEVLFIKLVGGGSLFLAMDAILAIKKKFPDVCISLLTSQDMVAFTKTLGVFDKIYTINDRNLLTSASSYFRTFFKILFVDTCIDLEVHSRISTVVSTLTLARNRIGFFIESVYWRIDIYTHSIFYNPFSPSFFFYDVVADLLGVTELEPFAVKKHLEYLLQNSNTPNELSGFQNTLVLGTTCSDNGRERMLSATQWQAWLGTTRDISMDKFDSIVLLGSKSDQSFNARLAQVLEAGPFPPVIDFTGKTSLLDSIGIIQKAKQFVGIDSSLLHFARALAIPCISFWGPTAPETRLRKVRPIEKIYYKRTACSPCIHTSEFPPCFGRNVCIDNLFSERPVQFTPITSFENELKIRED